jgi:hypothetical protein
VLDFVGQANTHYRFDTRFRALIGGTRQQIAEAIEAGFPLMPPGCAIRLDPIAQKIVLDNVRSQLRTTRRAVIDDLRGMPRTTTLADFLQASSFDLPDVYSSPAQGTTFDSARRAAGHLRGKPDEVDGEMGKKLGRMLHVDDDERFDVWTGWLQRDGPPDLAPRDTREYRLQLMLFAALGFRDRPVEALETAFRYFWRARSVRNELIELISVTRDRARRDTERIDPFGAIPLHSHATYGLYEIIAAYGLESHGKLRENREGLAWAATDRTDLLFITLNKADVDYSPTTRYQDYPISPNRFHWETQSKTSQASATGRRYINHIALGSKVLLFVRENREDGRAIASPYICLGYARHISHESERPIRFVWELDRAMPPELYERAKAAAG